MAEREPSSFRDPSGFLFRREGVLYRQVAEGFREHFDRLESSGLYRALVDEGLMLPHEGADVALAAAPGAYKVIRPEPLGFVSYPYEWCFGQLRDAARATIRIQQIAMDHGMSLRDASAYNIQFHRGRPTLIDTLSFETIRPGEPWSAYRQFCQHFLAPLALMSYRDVRLAQLMRAWIDGVPLDLAASLLPRRARMRFGLAVHLFAHARSQRRHEGADPTAVRKGRNFSEQAFRGIVTSLGRTVERLRPRAPRSGWVSYYEQGDSYSADAGGHKRTLVAKMLDEVEPRTVWDLGANTGAFSRLASERGIPTVAWEMDPACVEVSWRTVTERGEEHILPLVLDLTNPSPAIGWENRERMSVAERGPADLALALALIHHIAIANNVPLPRIASYLASLCRWLVIEFVPKSDPKAQLLLAARDDIFPTYHRDGFEHAFGEHFTLERVEPVLGSERVLYLMRNKTR